MDFMGKAKIAAAVTVITIGVFVVFDIIFAFHMEDVLFDPWFVIPTFFISYILSPLIGRFIKYK